MNDAELIEWARNKRLLFTPQVIGILMILGLAAVIFLPKFVPGTVGLILPLFVVAAIGTVGARLFWAAVLISRAGNAEQKRRET